MWLERDAAQLAKSPLTNGTPDSLQVVQFASFKGKSLVTIKQQQKKEYFILPADRFACSVELQ